MTTTPPAAVPAVEAADERPDVVWTQEDEDRLDAALAKREAKRAAKSSASTPTPTVEIWNGDRKVTIYPGENVLRIWGPNIVTEMSDTPWSHEAVQEAMRWLFAPVAASGQDDEVLIAAIVKHCVPKEFEPMARGWARTAVNEWRAAHQAAAGEAKP